MDLKDALTLIGSLVAIIISIVAYFLAKKTAAITNARTIWNQYLGLAFEYPMLSCPPRHPTIFNIAGLKISDSEEMFDRYEWFVSHLLISADAIFKSGDNEDLWRAVIERNIGFHAEYLHWRTRVSPYREGDYLPELGLDVRGVIDRAVDAFTKRQPSIVPLAPTVGD